MSMETTAKERPAWGKVKTKQSAEAESNINNIVKRFTKTGQLTHISESMGQYRDMTGIPDLHEAMNIVADANSTFQELPAEMRKAMGHDAANFLPWIDNPENESQAIEWGLIPQPDSKSVPTPTTTEVVTPDPETETG